MLALAVPGLSSSLAPRRRAISNSDLPSANSRGLLGFRGENQKRRGGNKRAARCVDMIKSFFEESFRGLCVLRRQTVDVCYEASVEISHGDLLPLSAKDE